jgi:hypothetical protein
MAVLAHIRKEEGLKGRALLEGAERILLLVHQHHLRLLPAFIPLEENFQADVASRFQSIPDWHLSPRVFLQISALGGSPPDRPLRISPFGADEPLLLLGRRGRSRSHRRSQPEVGLRPGLPLPSDSPPQEGCQEAGKIEGDIPPRHPLLGCPDVVCISPGTSRGGHSPPSLQRRPHRRPDDGRASSKPGKAFSSHLDNFRGIGESTPSRTGPLLSSRQDGSDPQRTAMKELGSLSRPSSAFPPFLNQASLRCVLDYLTHLYDRGYS